MVKKVTSPGKGIMINTKRQSVYQQASSTSPALTRARRASAVPSSARSQIPKVLPKQNPAVSTKTKKLSLVRSRSPIKTSPKKLTTRSRRVAHEDKVKIKGKKASPKRKSPSKETSVAKKARLAVENDKEISFKNPELVTEKKTIRKNSGTPSPKRKLDVEKKTEVIKAESFTNIKSRNTRSARSTSKSPTQKTSPGNTGSTSKRSATRKHVTSRTPSPRKESSTSRRAAKSSSTGANIRPDKGDSDESRTRSASPRKKSDKAVKSRTRTVSPRKSSDRGAKSTSRSPSPRKRSDKAAKSRIRSASPRKSSDRAAKSTSRSPSPRNRSDKASSTRTGARSPRQGKSVSPGSEKEKTQIVTTRSKSRSPSAKKSQYRSPSQRKEKSASATSKKERNLRVKQKRKSPIKPKFTSTPKPGTEVIKSNERYSEKETIGSAKFANDVTRSERRKSSSTISLMMRSPLSTVKKPGHQAQLKDSYTQDPTSPALTKSDVVLTSPETVSSAKKTQVSKFLTQVEVYNVPPGSGAKKREILKSNVTSKISPSQSNSKLRRRRSLRRSSVSTFSTPKAKVSASEMSLNMKETPVTAPRLKRQLTPGRLKPIQTPKRQKLETTDNDIEIVDIGGDFTGDSLDGSQFEQVQERTESETRQVDVSKSSVWNWCTIL